MSARAKSILLLLGSIAIGMVLGALLQARLAEERLDRLAVLRSERGLSRALVQFVEPVDDEQRQAIQAIVASSSRRMAAQIEQNREASIALLDSTVRALHEVLNEDQIEQLNTRLERMERRMRGRNRARRRPAPSRRQPPPPP